MGKAHPVQLAVLVSGGGTTLQNLIDEISAGRLDARIGGVIASKGGIRAINRALAANLGMTVVTPKQFPSIAEFSRKIFELCEGADLICLAGWLCLLEIPQRWQNRVMNIHPALLPSPFGGKGMYGHRVHEAVLAAGCKVSGCTVHFVNNEYDSGPIIVQKTCPVAEDDTPETLAARVAELERAAYPEAIRLFGQGRLRVESSRVRVLPPPERSP